MVDSSLVKPQRIIREVLLIYAATLAAIKLIVVAQAAFRLPADVLVGVPLLFVYVPVLWLRHKQWEPDAFGLNYDGVPRGILWNVALWAAILPPFLIGHHYYQQWLFHRPPPGLFPHKFWTEVVAYQVLFVAIPEEFFYRGYVQSRLDQHFGTRWRVLGAQIGPGLFFTALLFTVGHSIVIPRWWHFAILFPALLFGWLRARTGNIVAGALFHASCNILMVTLDTWYGNLSP